MFIAAVVNGDDVIDKEKYHKMLIDKKTFYFWYWI